MKVLIPAILLILSPLSIAQGLDPKKLKAIEAVIEMHQEASAKKHGQNIQFKIVNDKSHNAYGGTRGGFPSIVIFTGFIEDYTSDELVTVICHELGHILGSVAFKDSTFRQTSSQAQNPDAAEGEADYFAGGCLMRYLGSVESSSTNFISLAMSFATSTYEKIYSSKIDPLLANNQTVSGIFGGYPSKECRLYSLHLGILGQPRPACWFNPEK
jgi:hypothetical protein